MAAVYREVPSSVCVLPQGSVKFGKYRAAGSKKTDWNMLSDCRLLSINEQYIAISR
jgi:hypothetical protein